MAKKTMTRRRVLGTAAGAATVFATAPFVHGAHAAGQLSVAFWDHWVPGANDVMTKLCKQWADKEKVDIQIDFVTSQGDKLMLTAAAEAQARSGHDMITLPSWYGPAQTDKLENSDDVWAELIKRHGDTTASMTYMGKQNGHWIAPPAIPNTLTLPCVGRIDIFKEAVGLDLTQMYPAGGTGGNKELTDKWTWDFFLTAAEKCHKAGHPFGLAIGQTGDTANWLGALFNAYGAQLVDKDGNTTVKSEPVKQVLDYMKRLVAFLPPDVFAWDDSIEQQGADLRPGGADHEPAFGLGGGGARRPESRRAVLAFLIAEGAEGPLRPGAALVLGHLEILAEQGSGEEPGATPVGEELGRTIGRRQPRLRHSVFRQSAPVQHLGRGRPAQGRHLELPAARRGHRVGVGLARARQHRQPDLFAGDDGQDDRAMHPVRKNDRPGDRLGGQRAGRL